MPLRIDINQPQIMEKVASDKFGTYVSVSWKRLIDPYTPRDTGQLMQNVEVQPFKLHYKQKYASIVYYGENMNFQKINPYSTYEWDIKAADAGQLSKLYRTLNTAITKGRI